MIQIGVIMLVFAVASFLAGSLVSTLLCLAGGLLFISTRKADLGMKITMKSLVTPVDDSDDVGPLDVVMRLAAYAALAGAAAIAIARWISPFFSG